jgi:lysophospholipase L1-like esterase
MKKHHLRHILAVACCLAAALPAAAQNIAVKSGEKIAFLGDSITAQGVANKLGYVNLVIAGLKANGVDATAIPAGVSGNTSKDMLARLDRDVIAKKPDWMTLSCGVNDVWHGARGVALEEYKTNITQIVEKAQAANIKVVLLTSTMIMEDASNDLNQKLAPYNDFLRELAKQKGVPMADLNADMRAARVATGETNPKKNVLTVDGVHMNTAGNIMMAAGVLRAFGLNDEQLKKARESWMDMPGSSPIATNIAVTLRQYEQLQKVAKAQNRPLNDLINEHLQKYIDSLLASAPKG